MQAATDAYVAAQVFELAIKNVDPAASSTVTRTDLQKGLSMIKNNTIGGISPPLTYNDGTTPNPQITCFYLYKTTSSSPYYEPQGGLKLSCEPKADLPS